MYYLAKAGVPVPAEAPYVAHLNERKEWSYHQQKHQEALKNVQGLVDRRPPRSIDPHCQNIQALSRRFHRDAKNAEIGRENRKLIDKLTSITRASGPCAPPPGYGSALRAPPRAPLPVGVPGGAQARSRSLNASGQREKQRQMELENASMVRRILTSKSSFDAIKDERSYQRHKRNVNLLQRLPEAGQKPRSLPPLRSRPNSHPATLRGLEGLLLPSDLQRSMSGSALEGTQKALTDDVPAIPHATTAPPGSFQDPEYEENIQSETNPEAPALATTAPMTLTSDTPDSTDMTQASPKDNQPLRREWLAPSATEAQDDNAQAPDGVGSLGIRGGSGSLGQIGQAGILGVSNVSELQYADDWDEYSFNSSANASRAVPSRGPSAVDMSREPSGFSRGQSGTGMTGMSDTGKSGTGVGMSEPSGIGTSGTATSPSLQPTSEQPRESPSTSVAESPQLGTHDVHSSSPLPSSQQRDPFEADLFSSLGEASPGVSISPPKFGRRRRDNAGQL